MKQVTPSNAERNVEPGADGVLLLMAALVAAAAVVAALATLLFDGVAWYEAAAPCAVAGAIFVLHARWSLRRISRDPLSALRVMMAGIGVHFGVIAGGGLALILVANWHPAAVLLSLLAAFVICQPLTTASLRRRLHALPDAGDHGSARSMTSIPFAEASA